jgi:DNA-binding CsgD family transcriptional regulator
MTDGYAALTDKEKQTLRLIVRGHDAKSTARHLGLSVHTINERLRDARRKLAVSSSREAARMLLEREGADPDSVVDKQIGEAAPSRYEHQGDAGRPRWPARKSMGVAAMTFALGLLALVALPQVASAPDGGAAPTRAAETEAATWARAWLTLLDQGRWDESYSETAASFQKLNTREVWASVSEQARAPLGTVRSRVLIGEDSVPAPPAGVRVLKFRTSFANKATATETVSLAREDEQWRVVGVYIE